MDIFPFAAVRPARSVAAQVAALPYDVYDRAEAAAAVAGRPLSFLNIDRPETQFSPGQDMYAPEVYAKARELMEARLADGTFVEEDAPCFYLYRLATESAEQTGIVACCKLDDYVSGKVKRHENTRAEKERDRIQHIEALSAQTGPIFLTYRGNAAVDRLVRRATLCAPLYDFEDAEGVHETVWRISDHDEVEALAEAFRCVPCAYIADGHHRAASAVKVGLARRRAAAAEAASRAAAGEEPVVACGQAGGGGDVVRAAGGDAGKGARGEHRRDASAPVLGAADALPGGDLPAYETVMSVLFPARELTVLPYNRVVADRAGLAADELVAAIEAAGFIAEPSDRPVVPDARGTFGLFSDGRWWTLRLGERLSNKVLVANPVEALDVSFLQDRVLGPILGVGDPRRDPRISFVGGIRGTAELERRAGAGGCAFVLNATSVDELMLVADAELLMPPKSTWFEPKLRSGLFIHRI